MIIPFGKHKGKDVTEVPHQYLQWAADPEAMNQTRGKPWDKPFKVPEELQLAARAELERRGFKKHGLRWEL
jgi:Putative quorum-sensing-regulated virulence factor